MQNGKLCKFLRLTVSPDLEAIGTGCPADVGRSIITSIASATSASNRAANFSDNDKYSEQCFV